MTGTTMIPLEIQDMRYEFSHDSTGGTSLKEYKNIATNNKEKTNIFINMQLQHKKVQSPGIIYSVCPRVE